MIIDLKVGDVVLHDVDVVNGDGIFSYVVPDIIAPNEDSLYIQQVTIEHGIGPAVKKSDLKEALQNHLADLQSD